MKNVQGSSEPAERDPDLAITQHMEFFGLGFLCAHLSLCHHVTSKYIQC